MYNTKAMIISGDFFEGVAYNSIYLCVIGKHTETQSQNKTT